MDPIFVIASSAGGLGPLMQIVGALPVPCRASMFIVQHIGANRSWLPDLLAKRTKLPVAFARHGDLIEPGRVYVAPPDVHMRLRFKAVSLDNGPKVHHTRPAADPLFMSAAIAYGKRVVGIVLSGGDGDGADGLRAVTAHGGLCFVQAPEEAATPDMPLTAIRRDDPDASLNAGQLAERVAMLCAQAARAS